MGTKRVTKNITEKKRKKKVYRKISDEFQEIMEHIPGLIYRAGTDWVPVVYGKHASVLTGYTKEELTSGKISWLDIIFPEDKERVLKESAILLKKPCDITQEYRIVRKDWKIVWVQDTKMSRHEKGKIKFVEGIVLDITERKKAEEALRDSKEHYRSLVENIDLGITMIDSDHNILMTNEALGRLLKKPVAMLVGKKCFNEFEKRMAVCSHCPGTRAMATGLPAEVETEGVRDDGSRFPVRVQAFPIFDSNSAVRGFIEVVEDISRRKQAEVKLHHYQEQLRSLVSELSLTEEREKRKLATELHDQVGQTLAVLKIKLGELQESASSSNLAGSVGEINELIEQAIQDTRSLIFGLSPPILYELGLEAAVEWLAEQMQKQYGIQIDFEGDIHSKPLNKNICVFLYLSVRELLMNVVKHAKVQKAKVVIRRGEGHIRITVQDDGVGCDTNKIGRGFGLFSIRERMNHIGGHLEIESKRNKGTRVTIIVPLKRRKRSSKKMMK